MSFSDDILLILSSYSEGYKLMRGYAYGFHGPAKKSDLKSHFNFKESTLKTTLWRLKKQGLIEFDQNKTWNITKLGTQLIKERVKSFKNKPATLPKHFDYGSSVRKGKKNMIVAFDIPEVYKKKRNWLRVELLALGFSQLQRSVWFGPAPLKKEFVERLSELFLLNYIKFFEASEQTIV